MHDGKVVKKGEKKNMIKLISLLAALAL